MSARLDGPRPPDPVTAFGALLAVGGGLVVAALLVAAHWSALVVVGAR